MKPQKSDFPQFVEFSLNIPDASINPKIEDAYKFTVRPLLGSLAVDIYGSDLSGRPELLAFYTNFVLNWWVLLAMKRFVTTHGHNLTQYGYTKTRDPDGTFDQLTLSERSVYLKQLDSDADVLYTNLLTEKWVFDGDTYRKPTDDCRPSTQNSSGISPLGTCR